MLVRRWRLQNEESYSAIIAVCFLVSVLHAQYTPAVDAAVQYSPMYVVKGYTIWMNGVSGSVAVNANRWFGMAGDVAFITGIHLRV